MNVTDKREIDTNGFVEIADNPISSAGVYPYLGAMIGGKDPAKIYYVLRSVEELSRPETLASLRLMPLIDKHEMLGEGETPAEDKGIHGVIGEQIYFDYGEEKIKGNIKIHSTYLMDKIDNQGIKELSGGYRADHDFTPGIYKGQKYDAIQKNIDFNHVAVVDLGRMGSTVAVLDFDNVLITQPEKPKMNHLEKLKAVYDALGEFLGEESKEEVMDEEEDEPETPEEHEEESKKVMDSADVEKVVREALGNVHKCNDLYEKLKPHTGVMDSAETMTLDELASYGVSKLGLECAKGHEASALQGFFAGLSKNNVIDGMAGDYTVKKQSLKDFE